MFQTIRVDEIFDIPKEHTCTCARCKCRDDVSKAMASDDHPSYWLAQLRKADWLYLLQFVDLKMPVKTRKQALAESVLQRFEFAACEGRGEVWQLWTELRHAHRLVVIQFRHSETDWSRGLPEFVHLEKNDPLGFVNIAGRLLCRMK